jgi:hypothetical protein
MKSTKNFFNYNIIFETKLILIISLFFSSILIFLNTNNSHSDYLFFIKLYKDLNGYSFYDLFPKFFNRENVFYYNPAEELLKLILWLCSNLSIPKIIFDFFFYFILSYCFFYISKIKKINFVVCTILFICSFYLWLICLSSIKNVIALDFFLISVICYLKEKKFFWFIFYTFSILTASGFVLLYFFFLFSDLRRLNFFFKKNYIFTIILFILPLLFSYDLMISRLTGYNVSTFQHAVIKDDAYKNLSNLYQSDQSEKKLSQLNQILKLKDYTFEFQVLSVNYKSKNYGFEFKDKKLLLKYKLIYVIKLIIFLFFIFLFSTSSFIYFIPLIFFSFLFGGMVSFEKFNLFLFIVVLINLLCNHSVDKKYNNFQIFFLIILNLYFFSKQLQMFKNLYYYNVPFLY